MSTEAQPRSGSGTHAVRWSINVGLLIGLTLALSVIDAVFSVGTHGYPPSLLGYVWLVMTWLVFPGTIVYLILLELIPSKWSRRSRRVAAIVLSPLMGAWLWLYLFRFEGIRVWGIVLLATLLYGTVVRLRPSTA